jgi:glycosyltransferase involved in cell wall biosynthesis
MTSAGSRDLSIVVPVYREETNIRPFLARLEPVLESMGVSHEIIFVLDPSPDETESVIQAEIQRNTAIKLLVLSRRFGQPAATVAGILLCRGDRCVVMDVDLQDPPELIPALSAKLDEGHEVVYAKRRSREKETVVKRVVSSVAYMVLNRLTAGRMPRDTGDFRIMTRRMIEELRGLSEAHPFLRGMVAYVGFSQSFVEYDREARHTGAGNYNRYLGSIKIGVDGLVSTGSHPLRVVAVVGALAMLASVILGVLTAGQHIIGWSPPIRLSATALVVIFFAGLQLLGLGLVAEYVGRIYDAVSGRPLYIVDRRINFDA